MRPLVCATLTASLSLSACNLRDRDLPAIYRRLEVPAARLASADVQRQGRVIYRQRCVLCHGENADGRGVQAHDLTPPPRDFTSAEWQRRTDDRRIYYAIAEGRHGTPMPPWKATLSPGEIWSLVAYVRGVGAPPVVEGDPTPARGP
jgi:mono/diheme cytochrome c family protein